MNWHGNQYRAVITVEQKSSIVRLAYTWSRAGEEDQAAKVSGTLVAEGSGGIDQSSNAVGLDSATNERRTPGSGGASSLL